MAESKEPRKLIANNKKARHDYFLDEFYEAGIELFGTEVKSMRLGKCSIKEAFVRIDNGEIYIYQMHISPYEQGNIFNKDPLRPGRQGGRKGRYDCTGGGLLQVREGQGGDCPGQRKETLRQAGGYCGPGYEAVGRAGLQIDAEVIFLYTYY